MNRIELKCDWKNKLLKTPKVVIKSPQFNENKT